VDNNDQLTEPPGHHSTSRAIQEFSVLQNTYDAEYGRSAGAQMNMVLKVGLAHEHDRATVLRTSALDARDRDLTPATCRSRAAAATSRRPDRQGRRPLPLSFIFINAEHRRAQSGTRGSRTADRRPERAGDFSAPGDGPGFTSRACLPGHVIPHRG